MDKAMQDEVKKVWTDVPKSDEERQFFFRGLRIVGDENHDLSVFDDNGNKIEGVFSVTIQADADRGMAVATIKAWISELDVKAGGWVTKLCPCCQKQKWRNYDVFRSGVAIRETFDSDKEKPNAAEESV